MQSIGLKPVVRWYALMRSIMLGPTGICGPPGESEGRSASLPPGSPGEPADSLCRSALAVLPYLTVAAMPASTAQIVTSLAPPALEHFVRGTLGCKCPDEVFRSIAIDHADSHTRLVIGNRLLIYVYESLSGETQGTALARLAKLGLTDRNAARLNRLRMVIASPQPELALADAEGELRPSRWRRRPVPPARHCRRPASGRTSPQHGQLKENRKGKHARRAVIVPGLLLAIGTLSGAQGVTPGTRSVPASAAPATATSPPIAAVRPFIVESPNGNRVDDYYWLRDDTRKNAAVLEYLAAENAYTDVMLAHVKPLEEKLYREFVEHTQQDDSSVPYRERGWWYYTRYDTGEEHPIYARKKGTLKAPEQVMLDGPRLASGHDYYQVGQLAVSPDNRLLAYVEDTVGRRQYTLRFKDLAPVKRCRTRWRTSSRRSPGPPTIARFSISKRTR